MDQAPAARYHGVGSDRRCGIAFVVDHMAVGLA